MAIRDVPDFPLRSDGLSQDDYSTGVENSLTALSGAIEDFNAAATAFQLSVTGTSTTSVAIGTGSKSFTTQTGLGFVVGMTLRIANSSTNYMTGDVTSYNSGTGALVVNVTAVVGSGTLASWTISLAATGANTAGAVSNTPAGNISSTNVQAAINELDTEKLSSAAGAVTDTNLSTVATGATTGDLASIPVVTFTSKGRVTGITTAPKITVGTSTATTSGTSVDFTGLSALAKRHTVVLDGVSVSGTDYPIVQLGDSGGFETTGYAGSSSWTRNTTPATVTSTAGMAILSGNTAASVVVGKVELLLVDASTNKWLMTFIGSESNAANTIISSSIKTLSATLDRVRFTSSAGSVTYDAGSITPIAE